MGFRFVSGDVPRRLRMLLIPLCMAAVLLDCGIAFADSQDGFAQEAQSADVYVSCLLRSYAADNGDPDLAVFSTSEPIDAIKLSGDGSIEKTGRYWPVLKDGEEVAHIISVESDGGDTYTLQAGDLGLTAQDSESLADVVVVERDTELFVVDLESGNATCVLDSEAGDVLTTSEIDCVLEGCTAENAKVMNSPSRASSASARVSYVGSVALEVEHLPQGSEPACWAVAAFQVGRYLTSDDTYTAERAIDFAKRWLRVKLRDRWLSQRCRRCVCGYNVSGVLNENKRLFPGWGYR